jgi:RIO kinase 1
MEPAPMRMPDSLAVLIDYGIIQEVLRPLMSGKEAQIYLVVSEGEERVAKVYKEANARTFKHRAEYTEGRKTRNSRDQRAMNKRTRHGREQDEAAWRSTEADMIHRLRNAGVRVPEVYNFVEGVLLMELVKDAAGSPAPRLGDLIFEPKPALELYGGLIAQVVRMLCAGVVHGDLSPFNVLMAADGPTLIDFPQAVDPAVNQGARRLLLRDVANLHRFLERFAPRARRPLHGEEMWELYQGNRLTPTTKLRGTYRPSQKKADTSEVLTLIRDADAEERDRRVSRGEDPPSAPPLPRRQVVDMTTDTPRRRRPRRSASGGASARREEEKPNPRKTSGTRKSSGARKNSGPRKKAGADPGKAATSAQSDTPAETRAADAGRRRRRRRGGRSKASGSVASAATRRDSSEPSTEGTRSANVRDGKGAGAKPRDPAASSSPGGAKKRPRRRRRPSRPR